MAEDTSKPRVESGEEDDEDKRVDVLRAGLDSVRKTALALVGAGAAIAILAASPRHHERYDRAAEALRQVQAFRVDSQSLRMLLANNRRFAKLLQATDSVRRDFLTRRGSHPERETWNAGAEYADPMSLEDLEAATGRTGEIAQGLYIDVTRSRPLSVDRILELVHVLSARLRPMISPTSLAGMLDSLTPCKRCVQQVEFTSTRYSVAIAIRFDSAVGPQRLGNHVAYRADATVDGLSEDTREADSLNVRGLDILWHRGEILYLGDRPMVSDQDSATARLDSVVQWAEPVANEIDGLTVRDALDHVEQLRVREREDVSLLGLAIDQELAAFASPLVVAALLWFLWVHLRHLVGFIPEMKELLRRYPWPPLFLGTGVVSTGIMVTLPVVATLSLLRRSGEFSLARLHTAPMRTTSVYVLLALCVILGAAVAVSTVTLCRQSDEKRAKGNRLGVEDGRQEGGAAVVSPTLSQE